MEPTTANTTKRETELWAEMTAVGLPSAADLDAWVAQQAELDRIREATNCRGPESK